MSRVTHSSSDRLRRSVDQIERVLHAHDVRAFECVQQLFVTDIAQTDPTDEPGVARRDHRIELIAEQLIGLILHHTQVHRCQLLDTETAQVLFDSRAQPLRLAVRQPRTPVVAAAADLAHQGQVLWIGVERLPDESVGHIGPVVLRGVDVVDAGVHRPAQHGQGQVTVPRRTEDTGARQLHGAEPDAMDVEAAQRKTLHDTSLGRGYARARTWQGTPLTTWVLLGMSRSSGGLSRFEFTPGWALATPSRVPGSPCPQPCGSDTTPGIISSVTSTGTDSLRSEVLTSTSPPSASPIRAASSGWISSVQRSRPAHQRRDVVQPGVVGAQMPPAGQQQSLIGPAQPRAQPRHVVGEEIVDQLDGTRGCGDGLIEPTALEFTEPQTVGVRANVVQSQPTRVVAQTVAPRAEPDVQVENAFRALAFQRTHHLVGIASGQWRIRLGAHGGDQPADVEVVHGADVDVGNRRAEHRTGQAQQHLPLRGPGGVGRRTPAPTTSDRTTGRTSSTGRRRADAPAARGRGR